MGDYVASRTATPSYCYCYYYTRTAGTARSRSMTRREEPDATIIDKTTRLADGVNMGATATPLSSDH